MNSTSNLTVWSDRNSYYIMCGVSSFFAALAIILSIIIVILIKHEKPRLHTVRHLLIANTCISSCFYCTIQTMNYIFLVFLPFISDDISCRWRGYLGYMAIALPIFSYVIQSLSRLLLTVYAGKYPWVTSFKMHRILIFLHWLTCFILPLSTIISNDIYYRPGHLCFVPMQHFGHVLYTIICGYLLPVATIIIIYLYVIVRVKKVNRRAQHLRNRGNHKRDLKVLRNIVILLVIYTLGGTPSTLYIATSIEFFYFTGIVSLTLGVFIEKLIALLLDRKLRHVVRDILFRRNRIIPFHTTTQMRERRPGLNIKMTKTNTITLQ